MKADLYFGTNIGIIDILIKKIDLYEN